MNPECRVLLIFCPYLAGEEMLYIEVFIKTSCMVHKWKRTDKPDSSLMNHAVIIVFALLSRKQNCLLLVGSYGKGHMLTFRHSTSLQYTNKNTVS